MKFLCNGLPKTIGQISYERDLAQCPVRGDGSVRHDWDHLGDKMRHCFQRNCELRAVSRGETIAEFARNVYHVVVVA